jgi:hypothetical protein
MHQITGDDGFLKVWEVSSGELKQSIRLESAVLAIRWANLSDHLLTFLVGASDGSITLFYFKLVIIPSFLQ